MLRHIAFCYALLAVLAVSWAVGQEPTTQPDPNAYPMNAAAVEATPFELKYPPEGEWESADAMFEAYGAFQEERIMGKPTTRDEAGKAEFRRVADFGAAFVQRFPTHEYTFVMLMNRWRFLGEETYVRVHRARHRSAGDRRVLRCRWTVGAGRRGIASGAPRSTGD